MLCVARVGRFHDAAPPKGEIPISRHQLNREQTLIAKDRARRLPVRTKRCQFSETFARSLRLARPEPAVAGVGPRAWKSLLETG